ncbi:TPM domain-containing protein [Mycobacterium asiaticum]|uniref:TPM domain-containing protein n=1 Tax=Mycobacterium asiaticum TaxID=1790 RepID=A0A1A3NC43_MYCAS|nr:TPM domain-containing protein [Mycobacterium asiaticum]OBK19346.1 hypothetical protein A5636_18245 [Mycobacterium asiaticum]
MRIVRLFGVVLTILAAQLLLATPVGAQPPSKLTDHITDSAGVLTDPGRAAVSSAIDQLYRDRHIQLWVVYVDNFSRFKPENWAERTRSASGMGDQDALLGVATNSKSNTSTKSYTFTVPRGLTADELNSLQRNQIEPAVNAKDWTAAALAAADGLSKSTSSSSRNWLPIVIVAVAVVLLLVIVILLLRARRRRPADPGASDAQVNVAGQDLSVGEALSRADARLRQISDYTARHRKNIGAEARTRLKEAQQHLKTAHAKEMSNPTEAIRNANSASTLAAQAQTLANEDVLAAHRKK